jgi:dephospho-CoA kinase
MHQLPIICQGGEMSDRSNWLIALVGMAGSGKSTVANYLASQKWKRFTFGDLTREELDRRGLAHIQAHERIVREEIRQQYGPDAYARLILPRIVESLITSPVVVDGLYSWAEYLYLHANRPDLITLCTFADRSVRYARLAQRRIRPLLAKEAFERDVIEIETLDKGGPIAMADHLILNNSDEVSLRMQVDRLIEEISARRNIVSSA